MSDPLHITSGDCAAGALREAGLPGDVLAWREVLYDGPRVAGWPNERALADRAAFLEAETGGGLDRDTILAGLHEQQQRLADAVGRPIVLWFDACLFDMAMLVHLLACLKERQAPHLELLCIDAFPGIEPYHGLGQLMPEQLASCYERRQAVTREQLNYAARVDDCFASRDIDCFRQLAAVDDAPLPWVPAAIARWLQELPDPLTGLGRLETTVLDVVRQGIESPPAIFRAVAEREPPPQYWGDTTLWAKLNGLADRQPPLITISGPEPRLPQWQSEHPLSAWRVTPAS